jgi:hypothetical protein
MQYQMHTTEIKSLNRLTIKLLPLLVASLLAACTTLGGGLAEGQVRKQANERWNALVATDFSRAYEFSTPGFKSTVPLDAYKARFGRAVVWVSGEVVDVSCPEAAKCIANVRVEYKPSVGEKTYGDTTYTHINETWLLVDSRWSIYQAIEAK